MEENKPKKSKALIITIIVLILLLIIGYLVFQNRDAFGVKTSASIAKIFSPLISSTNSKNLSKINENSQRTSAQAGEDIKGGDNVSVSGSDSNNNPIIMRSGSGDTVFGFASQDIANGDIGEVIINSGASNTFWDSFSGFLGGLLGGNNGGTTPPLCTLPKITDTDTGQCIDPSQCLAPKVVNGNKCEDSTACSNGADNPPLCNTIGGVCVNGATNPPICATGGTGGLTVTNPLPLPCSLPKITNTETGQCINASDCKSPKIVNGNKCEVPVPTACLSPKITDTSTGKCINASDCKSPKIVNGNKCEVPPETANACLLIDKNPLTSYFTDDEKSQLAELLRKFYLIAPNLKTEDDINIAYSTITQYQNFSEQLSTLINQCYIQTADSAYIAAGGPTLRFGNPWYKYNTLRGSYIDKTFDCKYVYGWFTGNGADGKDCNTYNQGLYNPQAPASCTKTSNFSSNYAAGLNNKCVWNPGANILDMEKISNVW